MGRNEDDLKKFAAYLEHVTEQSDWIGQVLSQNLYPIRPDATVACLAAGYCEELLQVRRVVGRGAKIFAFDNTVPNPNAVLAIVGSESDFRKRDIRDIDQLIGEMGGVPHLIVCRHPKVLVSTTPRTGRIQETQGWWGDVLSEWGEKLDPSGQMIITTFTKFERDFIAERMAQHGLNPVTGENQLAPSELSLKVGPHFALPDGFTITVRS